MRKTLFFLWFCLAAVALHPGCLPPTGSSGSANPFTNTIPTSSGFQSSFSLTRTYTDWNAQPSRSYVEKVWYKSENEYRIECTQIFAIKGDTWVPCSQDDVVIHNNLLKGGHGYFAVFDRGFRIRDPDLFLENYNYTIWSTNEIFLGRIAYLVRITSKLQDRPNYTVWIDRQTGLILKCNKDTVVMDPVTTMEVTALNLNPDFTGITFFQHDIQVESIAVKEMKGLGFPVYHPAYIPEGFESLAYEKQVISDRTVLKLKYTDGLQCISVAQYKSLGMIGKPSVPMGGGSAEPPMIPVRRSNAGGLYTALFEVLDTQIIIKAEIHEEELGAMLQSFTQLK